MPLEIRLSTEQFPFYEEALTKAKLPLKNRGLFVEIGADTYENILEVLRKAHNKSLILKTKTVLHMERLYNLERVIARIEEASKTFEEAPKLDANWFAQAEKIDPSNDQDTVEGEAA